MTAANRTIIGQNIRRLRERAGLTQEALGLNLDKDQGHVAHWERGTCSPHITDVPKICAALGASINEIFVGAVGLS